MDARFSSVGIVFISPIIGLPPSLMNAFAPLRERGAAIEGVDIFTGQAIKKNLKTVLGLTMLPGSHKRRVAFANTYDEAILFRAVARAISDLQAKGKTHIILGGMSGGFIFASRMAQTPLDPEVSPYAQKLQPLIKAVFGISPLIFYPSEVVRVGAAIETVPPIVPTILIWGDNDVIVPKGTIAYAERVAMTHPSIRCVIIKGGIRHQFFGGRDFHKPLTNAFWKPEAERIALQEIEVMIEKTL